jgi:hypothetical protein
MLEPQLIVVDLAAIDQSQQLPPELTLERDVRVLSAVVPKHRKVGLDAAVGDAIATKFYANFLGGGLDLGFKRDGTVETNQQRARIFWIGAKAAQ